MTTEQILQLRSQLLAKGYNEQQANEMINVIQEQIDKKSEVWAQTIQHVITEGLKNEAVQKWIVSIAEKTEKIEQLNNESERRFHDFLSWINIVQKLYSILFVIVGGGVLYFLGTRKIIGQETCQILLTMIITLTVTDAISTFLKASKSDDD